MIKSSAVLLQLTTKLSVSTTTALSMPLVAFVAASAWSNTTERSASPLPLSVIGLLQVSVKGQRLGLSCLCLYQRWSQRVCSDQISPLLVALELPRLVSKLLLWPLQVTIQLIYRWMVAISMFLFLRSLLSIFFSDGTNPLPYSMNDSWSSSQRAVQSHYSMGTVLVLWGNQSILTL